MKIRRQRSNCPKNNSNYFEKWASTIESALLDDASTQTYVNEDVAAELGLIGTFKAIKANVLNGECKSFQTIHVEVGLESVNGDVDIMVTAHTVNRVTGNMKVIQWSQHADNWFHLKHIEFPNMV